jgi:Mg2+/citrate symporter
MQLRLHWLQVSSIYLIGNYIACFIDCNCPLTPSTYLAIFFLKFNLTDFSVVSLTFVNLNRMYLEPCDE